MRGERRRKKQERRRLFLGIFIVAIMVLSVIGFSTVQDQSGINQQLYNGFIFSQRDSIWFSEIDGRNMEFHFLPQEVDNLFVDDFDFEPSQIYVVSNPNANYSENDLRGIDLTKFELRNKLRDDLGFTYTELGYTEEYLGSVPTSCEDAGNGLVVIDISLSNETGIFYDNECVRITANNGVDIVRLKDLFLYRELGVI